MCVCQNWGFRIIQLVKTATFTHTCFRTITVNRLFATSFTNEVQERIPNKLQQRKLNFTEHLPKFNGEQEYKISLVFQ